MLGIRHRILQTFSVPIRQHILTVFENWELRRIFEPKSEEVGRRLE
jgi:hypothetical protein